MPVRRKMEMMEDHKEMYKKGKRSLNIFLRKQKHEVPKEKQTAKLLWRPPEEGWIKINVDGSYVERTGQASAGVIIQDHKGPIVAPYILHTIEANILKF